MLTGRRQFLKTLGCLGAAGVGLGASGARASESGPADPMGVLVDLTLCVGCRRCEYECRRANGFDAGHIDDYEDPIVFETDRRPSDADVTVVNRYNTDGADEPVYAKVNCLHCNQPACVSACIVGALEKHDHGAVTYDAWKCIGCRYCMVACPFQIPAYEYGDAFTPEVRKCEFCHERTAEGELPACVAGCPREAMVYGKRRELIDLAHKRIATAPDQYHHHVYGEHEVGGTSWMYLSPVPFEDVGFLTVGDKAPGALTEAIQHGVFKYWIAPIALYAGLSGAMYLTRTRRRGEHPAIEAPASRNDDLAGEPASVDHTGEAVVTPAPDVMGEEYGRRTPSAPARRDPNDLDVAEEDHDHAHGHAEPAAARLLTPGFWAMLTVVIIGGGVALYRFIVGLEITTNLDQQHPWGLWIAMDVGSGIALAGGGFMTAALVHIFHREKFHAVARSALLTALLGYTFYVPGLLADLGRWYNLWHPTLPSMWQVNSVLFEVGICVMIYLNVQYAEMVPIVCERLVSMKHRPRVARIAQRLHAAFEKVLPALLVLGVTLSCFHQSSLGNLMVIAPYKLHPLWWSPLSPLMFLLSAMMVGFPMVIFTILFASRSLNRKPEMHVLGPLALYVPSFLFLYLALKVGDMAYQGTWVYLLDGSYEGILWLAELGLGVVLPMLMLLRPGVRRSPRWLGAACLLVILGVVLNRLDVFVLGYHPPYAEQRYFPSVAEFAVSAGLIAALMLVYRLAVTYLPILEPRPKARP